MNETIMTDENPKKKLGRGLSALLGDDGPSDYADLDKVRAAKEVPVEQLRPNRYQPRQDWNQEALDVRGLTGMRYLQFNEGYV